MQQFDALTLKHLGRELGALLGGAKINKVQHLTRQEFLLGLWAAKAGNRNRLYVNLQAELPCVFPVSSEESRALILPTLPKPTGFCMLLRKHLTNARIAEVATLPGERVINIVLENFNELGNRVRLILSLELMGKHSNMILIDDVQEVILGAARTVTGEMSRYREVAAGLPYVPPPQPRDKPLIFNATQADLERAVGSERLDDSNRVTKNLLDAFWGLGPATLKEILALSPDSASLYENLRRLDSGRDLHPALRRDFQRFTLLGETVKDDPEWGSCGTIRDMVSAYARFSLICLKLAAMKRDLLQVLKRQREKLSARLAEQTPAEPEKIEVLQKSGNLILNAFSAGELSATSHEKTVTVTDYETGQPMTLAIDPDKSWPENAQRYFRLARKEQARQAHYEELRRRLSADQHYINELAWLVEQADSLQEAAALHEDLCTAGLIRKSPEKKEDGKAVSGLMSLTSSDGFAILVGKSGQANADLVGKLSRADDLWLHVHEMPGSHVVIKTDKREIPDRTLLEAANLAVWFSSARQSRNVPVIYTSIRYVRKIPGSYPGHVNYRQEQSVFITPDRDLLNGLLPRD